MSRQRILVLGAGGYIGRRIVARLAAGDWALPVAAWHRRPVTAAAGSEALRLDATDAAALRAALAGVAGVVNCVAGDPGTIVTGAQRLFEAVAAQSPAPRVVHLSSMAAYGSARGLVDESAPLLGDLDGYSAAKARVEELARGQASVVCLRPGIVYGPGSPNWSLLIGSWLRQRRLGDLGEAGEGCCNLVHVDDVVTAVERALRLPGIEGRAYNLGCPEPPTWNGYFAAYAQALGVAPVRKITPLRWRLELQVAGPLLKLAEVGARAARLRWRPPAPIRPWLATLCRHDIRLDVRLAGAGLGMQWLPLAQGLREAAASVGQGATR
jgi:nucleoside-diphosphate-sugar epimerase